MLKSRRARDDDIWVKAGYRGIDNERLIDGAEYLEEKRGIIAYVEETNRETPEMDAAVDEASHCTIGG